MIIRKFTNVTTTIARRLSSIPRKISAKLNSDIEDNYSKDDYTNVTPRILEHINRNLHTQNQHPLSLIRQQIVDYFYKSFKNTRGNPIFSIHDRLSPIVSIEQNFGSLLIPPDHPSRAKSDCYYLNRDYLLRAHTTAHQSECIRAGLDAFLIVGDVYRRDEIDSTHYPVFHQVDAVRLVTRDSLFPNDDKLQLFEVGKSTEQGKQPCHTLEAVKLLEHELKSTLVGLAKALFGDNLEYRWTDTEFPFTCPSWELEVRYGNTWLELLGCGIMKQPILTNAGVTSKVGWAFGLGLERVAMRFYAIPDIRLFWSRDSGFLSQFQSAKPGDKVNYKPVSQYPQCTNDISFWLPQRGNGEETYNSNDFFDLVRSVAGDIVEQVVLVDEFTNSKNKQVSHCYRIVYRHMEKTLTQREVNVVHKKIEQEATQTLRVKIR